MATIFIDDKPYSVRDGQNLLSACLSLGFDIPYFCWHPVLGSVGACRQCAVKQFRDEQDKKGRIVMSCMTPAADGSRISIDDPEVRAFRAAVIEWLMLNHPHDCPVCDEGGECHLQDMTVMSGHNYRRSRFRKRTHRNQNLGPFINHEMNRCIQCYRCLRFYRNYAGGRDFNVFASRDHVYFGRHREGTLENAFSGNLVEICPTGVFTDKTLKGHYTRKWDLQTAPSICVHCSLGCNTLAGERYGILRRIRNRYHHQINGYFLCDRGRFGYEFVNGAQRVREPLRRGERGQAPVAVAREAALDAAAAMLGQSRGVIGIGSPRASLEANFMLRELVGAERFYAGVADGELDRIRAVLAAVQKGPVRVPSLQEAADADVVFVLGEDLYNSAPLLALNLRQLVHRKACKAAGEAKIPFWDDAAVREVVQHEKEMLFIAAVRDTYLDDVAMATWHGTADDLARLGYAVAAALDPAAPAPPKLDAELSGLAETIAQALRDAECPLVVSGTGCGSRALIEAAANVAYAAGTDQRPAGLLYAVPECNSVGLGLLEPVGGLDSVEAALKEGACDTLVILENDLFRRMASERAERLLEGARRVLVLDEVHNRTTAQADLLLPAAPFAEATGTLVNNEGRAQRFFAVYPPTPPVAESWRWLQELSAAAGRADDDSGRSFDDLIAAISASLPVFGQLSEAAPGVLFRGIGGRVPRQSHRYSGRTAVSAHLSVHEPKPPEDVESALAFSMEGSAGRVPPALISRYWQPGWNSVQALNKFQTEICGPLQGGDPGVRLLSESGAAGGYYPWRPAPAVRAEKLLPVAPLYHVFGSEELSALSPAVAARMPEPYLALNPAEAAALDATAGDPMAVMLGDRRFEVPLKILPQLPPKAAGLPMGLPGMPVVELPAVAAIAKGEKDE